MAESAKPVFERYDFRNFPHYVQYKGVCVVPLRAMWCISSSVCRSIVAPLKFIETGLAYCLDAVGCASASSRRISMSVTSAQFHGCIPTEYMAPCRGMNPGSAFIIASMASGLCVWKSNMLLL